MKKVQFHRCSPVMQISLDLITSCLIHLFSSLETSLHSCDYRYKSDFEAILQCFSGWRAALKDSYFVVFSIFSRSLCPDDLARAGFFFPLSLSDSFSKPLSFFSVSVCSDILTSDLSATLLIPSSSGLLIQGGSFLPLFSF